jgi:hypothetical protein
MCIQMQHTSLWACSPTCVLKSILIDPLRLSNLPLCQCQSYLIFVNYFSPFIIKYHKRWAQILDRLGWNHVMWGSFLKIWFNIDHLPKKFNSVWSKDKLLHTTFIGYLAHVELNHFVSFSKFNTRFISPQTCHMLPLDYVKYRSNSATIQASNPFDFHGWA